MSGPSNVGTAHILRTLEQYQALTPEQRKSDHRGSFSREAIQTLAPLFNDKAVVQPHGGRSLESTFVELLSLNLNDRSPLPSSVSDATLKAAKQGLEALRRDLQSGTINSEEQTFASSHTAIDGLLTKREERLAHAARQVETEEEEEEDRQLLDTYERGVSEQTLSREELKLGNGFELTVAPKKEVATAAAKSEKAAPSPPTAKDQISAIQAKFGGRHAYNEKDEYLGFEITPTKSYNGTSGLTEKEAETLSQTISGRFNKGYRVGDAAHFRFFVVEHKGKTFLRIINKFYGNADEISNPYRPTELVRNFPVTTADDMESYFGLMHNGQNFVDVE